LAIQRVLSQILCADEAAVARRRSFRPPAAPERSGAEEMFDLAEVLEEQVAQMMEDMEQIANTLGKLTSLRPKGLDDA